MKRSGALLEFTLNVHSGGNLSLNLASNDLERSVEPICRQLLRDGLLNRHLTEALSQHGIPTALVYKPKEQTQET